MGEAEKVKQAAEELKKGGGEGEKKGNVADGGAVVEAAPPPPPQEVVLRVYMHCEGCAKKVKRSLKGFEGVEEITTDCKTHTVVVKGKKAAEDPMQVVERVNKKSGRKVELLSPLPLKLPSSTSPAKDDVKKEEEKPKPVGVKNKETSMNTVVLKVQMHCEACAQEITKRILRMKGVETVEPDLKASQVTVHGVFEEAKLLKFVYKRTGKHAVIVKQCSPAPEKAADGVGEGKKTPEKPETMEKKETVAGTAAEEVKMAELWRKAELLRYYQRYPVEYAAYPPQIFSDENPNACVVM